MEATSIRLRVLICATLMFITPIIFTATAHADPCTGTYSIGIGGLNDNTSSVFPLVNQRVGYNSWDPMSGVNELGRLIWQHRSQCPTDHLKIMGHSEGAALAHTWVTANPGFPNANAVLLADPKRDAGPGGAGLSSLGGFLGYPLAGVDDWFGSWPVLTVCNGDDFICNTGTSPVGYATGRHGAYDFSPQSYSNTASGVWFR